MTRRAKAFGFAVLVCAALVQFAAASGAETRVDEAVDHALSGEITVVDRVANALTVRDVDGELTTLAVTVDTTILRADQPIDLADLAKGDRVVVEWNDRTGRNLATYIQVSEEPVG